MAAFVLQVLDLQEELEARDEDLRSAMKAVKREKITKMSNEVGVAVRFWSMLCSTMNRRGSRWDTVLRMWPCRSADAKARPC